MNDVKLRMLLWESVDSWAKTVDEWYHCEFDTLNVEDMNLFTAKNVKNINQLEKGLPPNLIVPKLKDEVELMKDKVAASLPVGLPNLGVAASGDHIPAKSCPEGQALDQGGECVESQVQG